MIYHASTLNKNQTLHFFIIDFFLRKYDNYLKEIKNYNYLYKTAELNISTRLDYLSDCPLKIDRSSVSTQSIDSIISTI